jgi:hypothetical protein
MVPDRFPTQLRELVAQFPSGTLQLEIGVQSLNPETGRLISRRQDVPKLIDNLTYLRTQTAAHLHVDLIVGLPGEGIESFARGFNAIVGCNPHEIQVGILKKLRGTPIVRHVEQYDMRFSDYPPYEILSTNSVSFMEMQRMGRFARYWDLVANSGNFVESRALLLGAGNDPFASFLSFSDWLFAKVGRRASISLKNLTELVFVYLTELVGMTQGVVGSALVRDYLRGGRSDLPASLREFRLEMEADGRRTACAAPSSGEATSIALKRQRRVAS